jgi:hypothetical protein
MNETIAKLADHLPVDDLKLETAVAGAKAAKHSIEKRYKKPPRKSKARFIIPVVLAAVLIAVGVKVLGSRGASQSTSAAPQSPADRADAEPKAASHS